jgi:drug/metabolite transporter (DMT)-like permease
MGLLGHLAQQPWWIAGIAADAGGFIAQFLALGQGPLVIVQPLLVSGLLFALPLGAVLAHRRVTASEIWAAAAVVIGLTALLLSTSPAAGTSSVHLGSWVVLFIATGVPVALLVTGAVRMPAAKPLMLASAAGIIYGLTAALTKTSAHQLGQGLGHLLGSWEVYALVAVGLFGMLLTQSAFQAGPLKASLPALTVADPVVSILIGITVLHETVDSNPFRLVVGVIGAAVMIGGVIALAPQIAEDEEPVGRSAHGDAR